jgi:hypothetical protein
VIVSDSVYACAPLAKFALTGSVTDSCGRVPAVQVGFEKTRLVFSELALLTPVLALQLVPTCR